MIFSRQILKDPFVLEIYEDIIELSDTHFMEYAESVLIPDIYFILDAKLSPKLKKTHKIIYHRTDQ